MRKIAVINNNKIILQGPRIKQTQYALQTMYHIFNNSLIAIIENNEIQTILTLDEFLNSEVK